jgi:NAD-dependent dihydropyrimidine dehydrogenase PreA subunit
MKHQYLKNVVTLCLSSDKCIGCGRCTQVCPHGVFEIKNRKVQIKNRDWCMECSACARNCPAECITVNPGVGCAAAVLSSWLSGSEANCDCSGGGCC